MIKIEESYSGFGDDKGRWRRRKGSSLRAGRLESLQPVSNDVVALIMCDDYCLRRSGNDVSSIGL